MGNFTLEETKQLINNKVKELRSKGVTEELFVAPVVDIRCFVPCNPGSCICIEDIPGFCVVTKNGYNKSRECFTQHLQFLKDLIL